MPGTIQVLARAAALLRLLGSTDRPLALAELAAALDLPRPTVHGILATLRDVGFVEQERRGGRYRIGAALADLGTGGIDPCDLRAAAMNWADALAGGTGLAVLVAVPAGGVARVVHHVFRPDWSAQRLRVGEELPLHATAPGLCLLAFAAAATPSLRTLPLHAWTGRTVTDSRELARRVAEAREQGWAATCREHLPGRSGVAVPLRAGGGITVGALGLAGPAEEVHGSDGALRPGLAQQLRRAAREIAVVLAP